ncbi:MAG: hypothetical protein ABEJ76_07750 [Halanaeroarchaeum sp.]
MHTRTVEQVESWETRPFSGGFRELQELADEDFSGAVVADDTWIFVLNGRVVGVFEGEIDDVQDAAGTVYTAPHDSLPLLFSMQERGGTTQAKYFTNDTPIAEADETLRDANFTGYVELSENVLSGDYYVVYYGGKSMAAAFIGQSERLVSGEEAFERANDEVGVFEVTKVSMNITEIPAPKDETEEEDGESDAGQAPIAVEEAEPVPDEAPADDEDVGTDDRQGEGVGDEDVTREPEPESVDVAEDDAGREPTTAAGDSPGSSQTGSQNADVSRADASSRNADVGPSDASTQTSDAGSDDPDRRPSGSERRSPRGAPGGDEREETATSGESATRGETTEEPGAESPTTEHERAVSEWARKDRDEATRPEGEDDPFREEAQWRETTSIPALDPDESAPADSQRTNDSDASTNPSRTESSRGTPGTDRSGGRQSQSEPRPGGRRASKSSSEGAASGSQRGTEPSAGRAVEDLKRAVEEREERIEALKSKLESAESEREDLAAELESVESERDELAERVESLESELETARQRGEVASGGHAGEDLSPAEAMSGTNLFVRYESKGEPTLSMLGENQVDRDAINRNLRLEHHTQFETEDATVAGEPFEAFLEDTAEYRFVDWLVRTFPYELLESDARSELAGVYEAVPDFDRIEFDGTVETTTESGETTSGSFDVVVRDRMGDPLVVAETNDSRDPVHEDMMATLVENATTVGEGSVTLSGAFYVTASYFEPGALERAQDAASEGGFFSRSDRESFVKTGRKRGYHLCLVEDRQNAFHITVPEL